MLSRLVGSSTTLPSRSALLGALLGGAHAAPLSWEHRDGCKPREFDTQARRGYAKGSGGKRLNVPPRDAVRERVDNSKLQEHLEAFVDALTTDKVEKVEVDAETAAADMARAKEYNKMKMREHRLWQRELGTVMRLQYEAIAALPPELQEAACEPELTPFPSRRHIFYHTPPKKEEELAKEAVVTAPKKRR